jgi:hypothetical protein
LANPLRPRQTSFAKARDEKIKTAFRSRLVPGHSLSRGLRLFYGKSRAFGAFAIVVGTANRHANPDPDPDPDPDPESIPDPDPESIPIRDPRPNPVANPRRNAHSVAMQRLKLR